MPRYLIIVARDQPALYDDLMRSFTGDEQVRVILDRRRGSRRQRLKPREPERRQAQRRRRPGIDRDPRHRSVVIIRAEG